MKHRILGILTGLTIVLSITLSAALWLFVAGIRTVGSFWGGGGTAPSPTLVVTGLVAILPALLAIAAGIFLRKHPKARAIAVGITLALAVAEMTIAALVVNELFSDRPVPQEPVPPGNG